MGIRTTLTFAFAVLTALVTSMPVPTLACTVNGPGWSASAPAAAEGLPLVFEAIGSRGISEPVPPIDASTFTISVEDASGAVVSGATRIQSIGEDRVLVVWTPDDEFRGDESYSVTIVDDERPRDSRTTEIVVQPIPLPPFGSPDVSVSELERASRVTCCRAASSDDRACRKDDCGSYPWSEECRLCRIDEYGTLTRMYVDWGTYNWEFAPYFEPRLLETTGSSESLIEEVRFVGHVIGKVESERCFVTEYASRLGSSIQPVRSPEFCIQPSEVAPPNDESQGPIAPDLADRCEPGTYEIGNYHDGFVYTGGPPPGPSSAGCFSGGSAPASLASLLLGLWMLVLSRRWRRPPRRAH